MSRSKGKRLKLPKNLGEARLGDAIPYSEYKLGNTAFVKDGENWFVAFKLTIPAQLYYQNPIKITKIIGVDIGVRIYAALSNGQTYIAPNKLADLERKKGYINKKISSIIHKNLLQVVNQCERCASLVDGISKKRHLCKQCRQAFTP